MEDQQNDPPAVAPAELIPGRAYRAALEDCCIGGHIVGAFVRHIPADPDQPEDLEDATLKFTWGELERAWQVVFTEVTP